MHTAVVVTCYSRHSLICEGLRAISCDIGRALTVGLIDERRGGRAVIGVGIFASRARGNRLFHHRVHQHRTARIARISRIVRVNIAASVR